MREIKFRYIWRISTGQTLTYNPLGPTQIKSMIFNIDDIEKGKVIEFWNKLGIGSAMLIARNEYIGQKDRNGIEIYEGDIVQRRDYDWQFFPVEWYCDGWSLGNNYDSGDFYEPNHVSWEEMKVIGNICKNPELIQGKI